LIDDYDKTVQTLMEEIEMTVSGDKIIFTIFLLLPGTTSEGVLDALGQAAKGGAGVELTVDVTIASLFARVGARKSLLPKAYKMAREIPTMSVIKGKVPDHSKYAIFIRKDSPHQSVAVWGGMNLGDHFQKWKDYCVRVQGPVADLLQIKIAGTAAGVVYPPTKPVNFVLNSRHRGYEEMYEIFHAMMQDVSLVRLQIAMAYIDNHGANLLQFALDRGAEIDLLMAQKANVYHNCNMRTLKKRLIGQPGLRIFLHPAMVHAKAVLAYDEAGIPKRSMMGSANLKKNSFGVLQELNSMIDDPKFNQKLANDLDKLFGEAVKISKVPKYGRFMAGVEEYFG
jgi:phosphatidylserine/phosphatidylglycerophosphate/cardiolipin synthase-like enzyme